MNKQPLPVVQTPRTEFGFKRTQCDCSECTRPCHNLPGYLIPDDLPRIHQHVAAQQDLMTWAKEYLLASPGALAMRDGEVFRIPTLVPARRPDGACIFLTAEDRCAIHAVSPFGCAFFDSHTMHAECDRKSKRGLHAIIDAWEDGDIYAPVWLALAGDGLIAPPPEVARKQIT